MLKHKFLLPLTQEPSGSDHVVVEHADGVARFRFRCVHCKRISRQWFFINYSIKTKVLRKIVLRLRKLFETKIMFSKTSIYYFKKNYPLFHPEKLIIRRNSNKSPARRNNGTNVSSKQS